MHNPQIFNNTRTVKFLRLRGTLAIPATRTTDITRPGVAGHAFRVEPKRGAMSQLTSLVDVGKNKQGRNPAAQDVRTLEALYRDFVNTLVTVRMDPDLEGDGANPREYEDVMVHNVHIVGVAPVTLGIGGTMTNEESVFLVTAQWTVQHSDMDHLVFP